MPVTYRPRTGLPDWTAGTDPLTRVQLDDGFASVEDLMALDAQGTLAARPLAAAANRGLYYYATDNGLLYRSDGATWVNVTFADMVRTSLANVFSGGEQIIDRAAAADAALSARVTGEANPRQRLRPDGILAGAGGASALDVLLKRMSVNGWGSRNAADSAYIGLYAANIAGS